ncbi:MAG: hypothetical protein JWN48_2754 [Myxococcaceae bacterium]|nr:hypothetical protein [Myxococcaceae bacterium]
MCAILLAVAKKKAPRPRPRTLSRKLDAQLERKQEKLYDARKKLAAVDLGGSPERPLDVSSASVVETRAESEPCLRCGEPVRSVEHTTVQGPNGLLRVIKLGCRSCGSERTMFVRIVTSYLN